MLAEHRQVLPGEPAEVEKAADVGSHLGDGRVLRAQPEQGVMDRIKPQLLEPRTRRGAQLVAEGDLQGALADAEFGRDPRDRCGARVAACDRRADRDGEAGDAAGVGRHVRPADVRLALDLAGRGRGGAGKEVEAQRAVLIGEPVIVPVIVVLPFAEVTEVSSGAGMERGIALLEDSSQGVIVDVAVAEAVVGRPVDRLDAVAGVVGDRVELQVHARDPVDEQAVAAVADRFLAGDVGADGGEVDARAGGIDLDAVRVHCPR